MSRPIQAIGKFTFLHLSATDAGSNSLARYHTFCAAADTDARSGRKRVGSKLRCRARAGHGPEAGNRLIILPESRRREPNALMVETMKPEKEGEGGREGVCHLGQAYLSCGKKAGARLPSFLLSLLSKKREKRRWYKSNRSPKSHDCRRKEGATEGGRRWVRLHRLHHHPVSVALSAARKLLSKEKRGTREASLSHTRARCRRASEIGRRRERDGRARYLPEQKPIDRSFDRLFYLRAATFLFSDIRITIFRAGHFPRATSHEHEGWLGYCSSFVWEFLLTFFLA